MQAEYVNLSYVLIVGVLHKGPWRLLVREGQGMVRGAEGKREPQEFILVTVLERDSIIEV